MIIDMKAVRKQYKTGAVSFEALKGIDCKVRDGEFVGVVGPSGSGKSTLMNLMGCLDIPTAGEYFLEGKDVSKMTSNQLADIRNRKIGFVFQAFNLLPYATAFENVEVPLLFAKVSSKKRKERILELLSRVGLADKANNRPTEMSGGEMQRVAIARALASDPLVLLADEPTGNLDERATRGIMELFWQINALGMAVIMATHDLELVRAFPRARVLELDQGRLVYDSKESG